MTEPQRRLPDSQRKAIAITIMLGLVATLLAVGVNFWYTNRVSQKSDRDWCGLLVLMTENRPAQPSSELQRKYWEELDKLRDKKDC